MTALDVFTFLGREPGEPALGAGALSVEQVTAQLDTVTAMVKAYVRGNGFTDAVPAADLAAVIVSATARAVTNPAHAEHLAAGPFTVRPGTFDGWTLPELAILHTYRRRAA